MWTDLESADKASKRATSLSIVLAFLSAIAGLLTLIGSISFLSTLLAVILAFLSGTAGILSISADRRRVSLEEAFKRTPPDIGVSIKTKEPSGEFVVVIEPRNKIPFEFQWVIVTKDDQIISGIPLEWGKVYPKVSNRFFDRAEFDTSKVVDNYIELRFKYRSLYAQEVQGADLTGRTIKNYVLSADKKFCLPMHGET